MGTVIGGIYEIDREIGSGGGGIVYLGRHLRLEKQVVLKADKRTLNTRAEALRREVDMLKGLSHTYIPQVYDFVQQDGVVYTVMDFIEGESLDKLLKRGELPGQPQVIGWACQLLEALCYLHSRPPHGILHGDIKPANIMLRPNGDVCLIDYNIALALGEDGAVKVGRSRGYASPEHYGISFFEAGQGKRRKSGGGPDWEETETAVFPQSGEETVTMRPEAFSAGTGGTSGQRPVMLDVRSDIYSLGATLYHLLSGRRPQEDARTVVPLGPQVCSPAVWEIIRKAMCPAPAGRYQSAQEMLTALRLLHRRDKRFIRHRRRALGAAVFVCALFLAGGGCAFTGLKQLEQRQTALTLAEYSADRLARGDVEGAVALALEAIPQKDSIFEAPVTAQAQKALTDALGVYDLSDGFRAHGTIELPSAPFAVTLSPEGSRIGAVYSGEAAVFDAKSKKALAVLPIQDSALSQLLFMDESRILYAGDEGVAAYDVERGRTLWKGEAATTLALSADGQRTAAVDRDEDRVVFYRTEDGQKLGERSFQGRHLPVAANDQFANPNDAILALNQDGSLLAVSFSDGGLVILDADDPEGDMIMYDQSGYTHFEGGFCGDYFAFAANGSGNSEFGLIDVKEARYIGGFETQDTLSLSADGEGIYLASGKLLASFDPVTLKETELAYSDSANIVSFSVDGPYALAAAEDGSVAFYGGGAKRLSSETGSLSSDFTGLAGSYAVMANRSEPVIRIMSLESHPEAQLLAYDARRAHDEARVSKDGTRAMLFDYQGFSVYDMKGTLVAQKELPEPETIYDQQFRREDEGSYLEVIWYDGTVRHYSAEDGSLISEEKKEPPSKKLYEEFETEDYRIESDLHSAPRAYDRRTGRLIAVLEEDAYLTYVTQEGGFIITEYVDAQGERFGLLLNSRLETLARLPGLCDIFNGRAIFDDRAGNLRQCRLYSLEELVDLGRACLKEKG